MTDIQAIMEVLSDRKPHHVLEIMNRVKPGAVNFAARSRISDIRKILEAQGEYTISTKLDIKDKQAIYQVVKIAQNSPKTEITHYTSKEWQKTNLTQKKAESCDSNEALASERLIQQELGVT